jgi:two-component system, NarL family, nitrate/nitrite response regulator NarL
MVAETGRERIRVLLVDDHALFREGLVRLLGAEPDFEIAGHCATVEEALDTLAARPVDIVLLDVDLGRERGSAFLLRARQAGYTGRVLVVTAGLTDAEAAFFLHQGAAGIFHKHDAPAVLLRSIRRVMSGEAFVDQRTLTNVLRLGPAAKEGEADATFTEREREVLRGVFEGLGNKEIAARLSLSESSVKAALQQLFGKTGVRTRSQLVRIALERYRNEL